MDRAEEIVEAPSQESVAFWVIISIVAVVLTLVTKSSAFMYIAVVPILIVSIWNFSLNILVVILALNFAATWVPWMVEYTTDGRWVVLFLLAIKFALPMVKRGKKVPFTPIQLGFGIFCLVAFISSLDAIPFQKSFYRSISLLFLFFAVFLSLWRYMDSREKVERLIRIFVYVVAGMILGGVILPDSGGLTTMFQGRLKGLYINPNTMGLVLTFQVPLAFWLVIKSNPDIGMWRQINRGILGLSILSLVLSGSRAAMVGVIIGYMVYLSFRYKSRALIYVALFFTFVGSGYGIFSDIIQTRFFQSVVYRKGSLAEGSGRLGLWKRSIQLSKNKPVLGYGFGTSEIVLWAGGETKKMKAEDPHGIHTHNSFLRILVEMGWVGIGFCAVFMFSFFRCLARLLRSIQSEELFELVAVITMGIVAAMIDSIFESWALSVGCILAVPFWIFVMLIYRMEFDVEDFTTRTDTARKTMQLFIGRGEDEEAEAAG